MGDRVEGGPRYVSGPADSGLGSTVTVKAGDTLESLASTLSVSVKDLLAANPQIQGAGKISPGQEINLPNQSRAEFSSPLSDDSAPGSSPLAGSVQNLAKSMAEIRMRQTTASDLVAKALSAGLSPMQAAKLSSHLNSLPASQFNQQASLVQDAMKSGEPERALKTYLDVAPMQMAHPDRITPDIERALVMGVGTSRTNAPAGKAGVMGEDAARHAAQALVDMLAGEYKSISAVLKAAGTGAGPNGSAETERALILKAVGARQDFLANPKWFDTARIKYGVPMHATNEIIHFAEAIRGRDRDRLIEDSTVQDLSSSDGDHALQQRFTSSCAPTAGQILEAEADPVTALLMHRERIDSNSTQGDIAREQAFYLKLEGGKAVAPGQYGGKGVSPQDYPKVLNDMASDVTHRSYGVESVGNSREARTQALDEVAGLLQQGIDVPLGLYYNGDTGHAVIATDVRGEKPQREFLITNPGSGTTGWLKEGTIEDGNNPFLGSHYGRLTHIYPSVAKPATD